jgi:hypothetical protein
LSSTMCAERLGEMEDLLPTLHFLRSLVLSSGDQEESTEVDNILDNFGHLESVYDGFESLSLVQSIKSQLLELVTLKVGIKWRSF